MWQECQREAEHHDEGACTVLCCTVGVACGGFARAGGARAAAAPTWGGNFVSWRLGLLLLLRLMMMNKQQKQHTKHTREWQVSLCETATDHAVAASQPASQGVVWCGGEGHTCSRGDRTNRLDSDRFCWGWG